MGYIASKSLKDSGSSVFIETFTDVTDYTAGTTTQLTTSEPLPAANAIWIYFDGVKQHHSEYGVSGYTVTFNEAIPLDTASVEIQFNKLVSVGVAGENTVTHSMMTSDNISTLLRKNAIINSNFDIWQRGTSQTTNGYGSDDRWNNENVGSTKVASQQTFTLGQTDVPSNPTYFSRTVVTSVAGASNYVMKGQNIESVRTFAGETVTVSFWAKADTAKNIATGFLQFFGSGGSPSATVSGIGATTHSLTTSWAKYTTTVTIPSISSKTLGTNNNDFVRLEIWMDSGTTYDSRSNSLGQQSGTFDIAQVQIEKGSTATEFERRSVGEELQLCQRYYQKSYDYGVAPGTISAAGTVHLYVDGVTTTGGAGTNVFVNTRMRTIPTVVSYSPTTGASGVIRDYTGGGGDATAVIADVGPMGFMFHTNTTLATDVNIGMQWTADAEL